MIQPRGSDGSTLQRKTGQNSSKSISSVNSYLYPRNLGRNASFTTDGFDVEL